ncbi:hypothetical protein PRECH8_26250 [Insulibacter thermoxylanivorax]|uniref:DUF1027 domain-containing protein n=1 Tax=Insulibacter thermoxylanivorax TaxID=2749268 RepID=A0A916QGN3_9BACL|nr:YutD family protein [Insulibacter thermoxylanivorax]GFR39329.1 hypothetical protein PRECH8_26250 [Insulibacter thermoxylanivorax]
MIQLGGRTFQLAYENKNGWNYEAFRERYSDILDRYDYIVGDWGYNQLRLKGFYREGNPKGTKDTCITSLQEYIQEYCNFGCAYFVLERIPNKSKSIDQALDHQDHYPQHKESQHKHKESSPAHTNRQSESKETRSHHREHAKHSRREAKEAHESMRRHHHQQHRAEHARKDRKAGRDSRNA